MISTFVEIYDSVFGNSKILHITRFSEKELEELRKVSEMSESIKPARGIKTIRFTLNSQEIVVFNGGAYFGKFHESMSLYVSCETKEQIDKLWSVLSDRGEEQPCNWVKDRFGVSWQIVPSFVWEVDEGDNLAKAERMNIALFGMKKMIYWNSKRRAKENKRICR